MSQSRQPRRRLLIAEDEAHIASYLSERFTTHGFRTTVVSDGETARRAAMSGGYDLMILDIGLPGEDGFTVVARLRAASSALPVIILSARDTVADTVYGLEGGADDYLTKPFSFEELLARVRLRLRLREADSSVLRRAGIALETRTRQAYADGRIIQLSAREAALLEHLMRNAGSVLSREDLLSDVWGYEASEGSNVVDVYVRYLRRKLGASRIVTVRGQGYRLEGDELA
ncbi:response regulator transcription factor [Streptomyces lomondensis]|uniref:DNA-binding response regulator n=1 Tax=Streptomyces lomondensis TaxID=68229 RepID=A0ABQ2XTG0_9ACTN|nr:response regulator transcription factor [Streptomyces lomondensis]MCF0082457.1 response regulator transcription factor [Streptomyces lomondensis]GGX33588.1 DNA-binding response regulator [Streptomyces lomondensis]